MAMEFNQKERKRKDNCPRLHDTHIGTGLLLHLRFSMFGLSSLFNSSNKWINDAS